MWGGYGRWRHKFQVEGREWRRLIKGRRLLWKSKQGSTAAMESRLDECVGRVKGGVRQKIKEWWRWICSQVHGFTIVLISFCGDYHYLQMESGSISCTLVGVFPCVLVINWSLNWYIVMLHTEQLGKSFIVTMHWIRYENLQCTIGIGTVVKQRK